MTLSSVSDVATTQTRASTAERFEFGVSPFYFLRHGETPANEAGLLQGQKETEETVLNATGRQTALRAAATLSRLPLRSIYASPLKRAWATARIVSLWTGLPVQPLPGLMERSWGIYEGMRKSERPSVRNPETVETVGDFTSRIVSALGSIAGPSPVLLVSHSGVFRALCGHVGLASERYISLANGELLLMEPPTKLRQSWRVSVA